MYYFIVSLELYTEVASYVNGTNYTCYAHVTKTIYVIMQYKFSHETNSTVSIILQFNFWLKRMSVCSPSMLNDRQIRRAVFICHNKYHHVYTSNGQLKSL